MNARRWRLCIPIILGCIDAGCSLMHMAYDGHLRSLGTDFQGFLRMENLLVALLFLAMGWRFLLGGDRRGKGIFRLSLLFWTVFLIAVLWIRHATSTLDLLSCLTPCVRMGVLAGTGALAAMLSLVGWRLEAGIRSAHGKETV